MPARRPERPFGPGPYLRRLRLERRRDRFPFDLVSVQHIGDLRFDAGVTFLVGENGTGKSTLIEAIARVLRFDEQGGTLGFEMGARHLADDPLAEVVEPELGRCKPRDTFFLRAESFLNVAGRLDEEDLAEVFGGGRELLAQSHGESFLALAASRFGADGLYILDEPEAALSVTSALAFMAIMARATAQGSQFIVATHSPILLGLPGAKIYELSRDAPPRRLEWTETDPVSLTRSFLNSPETFLRRVLGDQ